MTTQKKKIVLLPGDGIGPEIMRAAVSVLKQCGAEFGHEFDFAEYPFGGCAIDEGDPGAGAEQADIDGLAHSAARATRQVASSSQLSASINSAQRR